MIASLLWTFPLIMVASIVIGWAAEISAVYLSAGIALAILAWLQTSPEFAVEAVIAWSQNTHLMLANFTGSLRLLMGLGWPMVCFIHFWTIRKKPKSEKTFTVRLPETFAVEAAGLLGPVLYFFFIWLTAKWTTLDGFVLIGFYVFYFWLLNLQRKRSTPVPEESDETEPWVVRKVLQMSGGWQAIVTVSIFVFGGLTLILTVEPFLEGLKEAALHLGISQYVFIQWIAPIASEMPEKITAFNWARNAKKVPMAIVNMLSSITSQWSLMAGMIPLIFSVSAGHAVVIELDGFQRTELLLTICQSVLALVFLSDLKVTFIEAIGLFILWLVQFFLPSSREVLIPIYILWIALELGRQLMRPSQMVTWVRVGKLLFHKQKR